MKNKSKLLTLLDRENKIYILKRKWTQLEEVENFLNQHKGKDLMVYCPYRHLSKKNYLDIDPGYGLHAYDEIGNPGSCLGVVNFSFVNQIFTLKEMKSIINTSFKSSEYHRPSYNEFTRRIRDYIKTQRVAIDALLDPLLKEAGENCEV